MTPSQFLLARIAEDEAIAQQASKQNWYLVNAHGWERPYAGERLISGTPEFDYEQLVTPGGGEHGDDGLDGVNAEHIVRHDPARVLAECEAKRKIVAWHESWPVLVESEPVFEQAEPADVTSMTFRMSKQIAWTTERKYRETFGTEPPTGPMVLALAAIYADHPDYNPAWSI